MAPESLQDAIEQEYAVQPEALPGSERVNKYQGRYRSWLRRMLIAVAFCGVAGFAAWKIHDNLKGASTSVRKTTGEEKAVPVLAVEVEQKEMPVYLSSPGTVTAYNAVTMRVRVDGQLQSVNIREGQAVRKGQLLAQIDPALYEAALAQAEGQLAKDQAAAAYANAAASRFKALYEAGIVSQDQEQTQIASAGQAEGAVLADRASIQAAKVNLAYTHIVSPIDGIVGIRQVDPGNIVHTTDSGGLFLVTQLQPIAVIFTLPEDQLPQVKKAMSDANRLTMEVYDHAEAELLGSGKLLTLDNEIDTTTGTDKLKGVFDNKDGVLFPNQFVNVRLILRKDPKALVIPASALQSGSIGTFVYVVKHGDAARQGVGESKGHAHNSAQQDNVASQPGALIGTGDHDKEGRAYAEVRLVTVSVTEGSQAIISSGLAVGERVVTDGTEKLRDHIPISLRRNVTGARIHTPSKSGMTEGNADTSSETASERHKHTHAGIGKPQ